MVARIARFSLSRTIACALAWACAVLVGVFIAVSFGMASPAFADGGTATEVCAASTTVAQGQPATIEDGLYSLCVAGASQPTLCLQSASFDNGAKVVVAAKKAHNAQKFVVRNAGEGCYRIGSSLSATSVTAESRAGTVRMTAYNGDARQLWRAERLSDGAVRFVNVATGMALAPSAPKADASVGQVAPADAQGFRLDKAEMSLQDRASYVWVAGKASASGKVKLSNKAYGYRVDKKKWKKLLSAVRACDFSLGFIMIDCNTGMTVSCSPGKGFFGASTIKGLYTTYLFEGKLETGSLSRGRIAGLVRPTIVQSNNDTYRSLRNGYGSQSGFDKWLRTVNVGSLGLWPSYSARTLSKAWVNMLAYSNSNGKHVAYWKRTFNHSYMSSIHDALKKKRTTYTKPGWMTGGTQYGFKLNDAGVVDDRHGRQYVIAILTSADPFGQKGKVQRVVKALDAIHMDMPKYR